MGFVHTITDHTKFPYQSYVRKRAEFGSGLIAPYCFLTLEISPLSLILSVSTFLIKPKQQAHTFKRKWRTFEWSLFCSFVFFVCFLFTQFGEKLEEEEHQGGMGRRLSRGR